MANTWEDSQSISRISACENVGQYSKEQIQGIANFLEGAQSWHRMRNDAAPAWRAAGELLDSFATRLKGIAGRLERAWKAEDAVACQESLQLINATAKHLSQRSHDVYRYTENAAAALESGMGRFPDWDRDLLNRVTIGQLGRGDPSDEDYQNWLAGVNNDYYQVNMALPEQVGVKLPVLVGGEAEFRPPPPPVGSGGVPGGGGGGLPGGGGGLPGGGGGLPGGGGGLPSAPPDFRTLPDYVGGGLPPREAQTLPDYIDGGLPPREAQILPDYFEPDDGTSGGLAGAGPITTLPGTVPSPGGGPGVGPSPVTPGGPGGGPLPGGPAGTGPGGPIAPAPMRPGGGPGAGVRPGMPGGVAPMAGGGGAGAGGRGGGPGGSRVGPGAAAAGARPGMPGGVAPMAGGAGAGGRGAGSSGAGARGPAATAGGAAAGAGAGRPMAGGMMPMGAGGRGGSDGGKHDSWLVEDDDPWGGDEAAPSVIE